jgi:outer membrane lipoprotein-sorting protein
MRKIILLLGLIIGGNRVEATTIEETIVWQQANQYLKNIKTLQGNFLQEDLNGNSQASGIFYLLRPQGFRFVYQKPLKSLLVGNNKTINYYDEELDEVSIIPIDQLPVAKLLLNAQGLENSFTHMKSIIMGKNGEFIIQTITQIEDTTYNIDYIFDQQLKQLLGLQLTVVDEFSIRYIFSHIILNQPLEKKIFTFINPHGPQHHK